MPEYLTLTLRLIRRQRSDDGSVCRHCRGVRRAIERSLSDNVREVVRKPVSSVTVSKVTTWGRSIKMYTQRYRFKSLPYSSKCFCKLLNLIISYLNTFNF